MRSALLILVVIMPLSLFPQSDSKSIEQLIAARQYQQAESTLLKLLEKKPDKDLRDKLGEVYGYQHKWDQAIAIYKKLTEEYPREAAFAFRYGGVLARKAQESHRLVALTLVGRIKHNLKRAIALDPKSIEAHWALVDLYISLPEIVGGSTSKAFAHAKNLKAISLVDGYFAMGYVHEYNENPEKAEQNYIRALGLLDSIDSMDRNQLNYQIGKVCGDLGLELDKGLKHMRRYIENHTALDGVPLKWAYFRMARLHRKKGNRPKAQRWVAKALHIDKAFKPALQEQMKIKGMIQ